MPEQQMTIDGGLVSPFADAETCISCGENSRHCETVDGDTYCPDCAGDQLATCDDCHDTFHVDDVTTVDDHGTYCDDCYAELFTGCYSCSRTILDSDAVTSDSADSYCVDCYCELFSRCESCDCETACDDLVSTPCGDSFCESCFNDSYFRCEDCGEVRPLENYSGDGCCDDCTSRGGWDSSDVRCGACCDSVGSFRHFGIELETSECDGYEDLEHNTCFGAKPDESINGMEFVSPILRGNDGFREIDKICNHATTKHFEVDHTCGFHLHCDVRDLSFEQVKSVVVAYKKTEKMWARFVPESRRENRFCRPMSRTLRELADARRINELQGSGRYDWLNVEAYHKHGTLEIRLHTGTLNAEKVRNWVRAHLMFIDAVAKDGHGRFSGFNDIHDFAVCAEIWGDELTQYYSDRSAKFGERLVKYEPTLEYAVA